MSKFTQYTPTSGAGSGDVTGPASSTDGDIVLFDGATGKLLQDGGVGLPVNDGELIIGDTAGVAQIATLTGGTGITVTNGAGSITVDADNNGDVVGPASSTDDNFALFDGATGKLIKDSGAGFTDLTSWTPTLSSSGGGESFNYVVQVGRYMKIGRLVFIQSLIQVNSVSGGSGNVQIGGLPFTIANIAALNPQFTLSINNTTFTASIIYINGYGDVNTTRIRPYQIQDGGGGVFLPWSGVGTNSSFILTGHYFSA